MKRRITVAAMISISLSLLLPAFSVSAEPDAANPSDKEIKQMLTDEAQEHDIPPEILKAIAFKETGYQQFDDNGDPKVSDDGGIGIMQVTPDNIQLPDVNKAKLKTDIVYNIKIGANVLDNKWHKDLPDMNNHKRNILENWYWPVAAYNGLSEANDPNKHPDSAYQEQVFSYIGSDSFLEQSVPYFLMPKFSVKYNDEGKMFFPRGVKYKTYQTTPSQQMYEEGDTVYIDARDGSVNFHQGTIDGTVKTLKHNTQLTITGNPTEIDDDRNDYVFYPVKIDGETGHVASAYLNPEKEDLTDFPDVTNDWDYPEATNYLAERNIINGKKNGDFNPQDNITREQAVRMLLKAMGRDFENATPADPGFNDVAADAHPFPTVALGTNIGFVGGKTKDTFEPYGDLKRAHIAKMMVEAYDLEGSSDKNFKDVPETIGAHDYIDTLVANDVINGYPDGTFRPWENIKRANFAAILYRYLAK